MANKYFLDLEGTKALIRKIVGYQKAESDPIFSASVAAGITSSDISTWNNKQGALVSGTNIKTINNATLLGSGNINLVTQEYLQQNYVHKPDVIYQYESGMSVIYGQKSASITSNWDLTNLDLTPYKYIKVFIKGSNDGNADNGLTSPIIVTVPLDEGIIAGGATVYTGSGIIAGANNHNRLWIAFCAVDSTKTKFQLIRTISLYGTVGTDASDSGRFLYRIEGWYDDEEAETGGSLPFTELDPTVPSYVKSITQAEITKWNSAITSETSLSKGTTTGAGNAVTDINVSGHEITLVKGSTFVTDSDLASYADGVEYDSTNNLIYLKHGNTRLANPISAAPFITDGMVSSVNIATAASGINVGKICLIITFNTDSGKSPIEIPISQIFDADDYYTKTDIDNAGYITSIKTINNTSLEGTGDVTIAGLPAVTAADNGKILRVVDGAWVLTDPVTLYSGAGTPNNSQGNNGDLYLQI